MLVLVESCTGDGGTQDEIFPQNELEPRSLSLKRQQSFYFWNDLDYYTNQGAVVCLVQTR